MAAETRPSDSWSDARTDSTSPSTSPSARLSAAAALERSASPVSSVLTSNSGISGQENPAFGKRRGFSRPQGTAFADSARNRDSVMSLGTIAHLQHYFARTGLLDGKGAQLAREEDMKDMKEGLMSRSVSGALQSPPISQPLSPLDDSAMNTTAKLDIPDNYNFEEASFISSPEQTPTEPGEGPPIFMLPPTISTYKQKSTYVPPPPTLAVLRRELREALEDAKELLHDIQLGSGQSTVNSTPVRGGNSQRSEGQGMYELQGLQILDLVTLAIRAAKNFYTSHEQPLRLYSIRSERRIRTDLFFVLEVLKKMATRNFTGGVRQSENDRIRNWVSGIEDLVTKDEELEQQEHEQMRNWAESDSQWTGNDRRREWSFLSSFDTDAEPLPQWEELPAEDASLPTPFLKALQDGRRLVRLHDQLVRKSRRHFELIKTYHQDVGKPYRRAENLQYWSKAAERRWDLALNVDCLGVAQGDKPAAWRGFDAALLQWSGKVREEMTKEWKEHLEKLNQERPIVRMDPGNELASPW